METPEAVSRRAHLCPALVPCGRGVSPEPDRIWCLLCQSHGTLFLRAWSRWTSPLGTLFLLLGCWGGVKCAGREELGRQPVFSHQRDLGHSCLQATPPFIRDVCLTLILSLGTRRVSLDKTPAGTPVPSGSGCSRGNWEDRQWDERKERGRERRKGGGQEE